MQIPCFTYFFKKDLNGQIPFSSPAPTRLAVGDSVGGPLEVWIFGFDGMNGNFLGDLPGLESIQKTMENHHL